MSIGKIPCFITIIRINVGNEGVPHILLRAQVFSAHRTVGRTKIKPTWFSLSSANKSVILSRSEIDAYLQRVSNYVNIEISS